MPHFTMVVLLPALAIAVVALLVAAVGVIRCHKYNTMLTLNGGELSLEQLEKGSR